MKCVIIRTDSSSTIGTGHVMRDLVLAKRDFADDHVIFATRNLPGNINHKIEAAGYEIVILPSDDIEDLAEIAKANNAKTIVIDHYSIGYEEERRLKEMTGCRLFVLDDTYEKHYCDILLNHNIYADPEHYKGLVPNNCELRCGCEYTLLRKEFIEAKKEKIDHPSLTNPPRKLQVFIAMGGADTADLNIPILETLKAFDEVTAHVVTTSANKNLDTLMRYARNEEHMTLHIDTNEIARVMARCDFAIVTPSVTLNEIFYMELPFIAIQTAENQKEMARFILKKGHPLIETFDKNALRKEIEAMLKYLQCELVDFTKLAESEKREILEWRNHPDVRRWMLTKSPISWTDHLAFIETLNKREDRRYFLLKYRGEPLGVIDFTGIDRRKNAAAIGLYVRPGQRGLGQLLMRHILAYGFETLRLDTLIAEVFAENEKATRLYRRFGFEVTGEKMIDGEKLLLMERYR